MRRLPTAEEAASLLAGGGVLLMPTDTIPGLHGRADSESAAKRIADLKGRGPRHPFLLLCADAAQALALCADPDHRTKYYFEACWPGPFTFVVKAAAGAPPAALAEAGTVALRVPEPSWLRRLVALAGGPLISTSANPTGSLAPADLAGAERWAAPLVDGIFDPSPGEAFPSGPVAAAGRPSALVDLTARPARLLREGPRPLPPEPPVPEQRKPRRDDDLTLSAVPSTVAFARGAVTPLTVLFVCTGNTCRSPLAEAFARKRHEGRVRALSAGLHAALGEPASEGSLRAAAEWGLDLSAHRSRPVTDELLAEADWVIVMTRTQARLLRQRFGRLPRLGLLGAPGRDLRRPLREGGAGEAPAGAGWFESLADLGLDEEAMAAAEEVADPFGRGPLEYGATAAQLDRLLRGWEEALGNTPEEEERP